MKDWKTTLKTVFTEKPLQLECFFAEWTFNSCTTNERTKWCASCESLASVFLIFPCCVNLLRKNCIYMVSLMCWLPCICPEFSSD